MGPPVRPYARVSEADGSALGGEGRFRARCGGATPSETRLSPQRGLMAGWRRRAPGTGSNTPGFHSKISLPFRTSSMTVAASATASTTPRQHPRRRAAVGRGYILAGGHCVGGPGGRAAGVNEEDKEERQSAGHVGRAIAQNPIDRRSKALPAAGDSHSPGPDADARRHV